MSRQIKKKPYILPEGIDLLPCPALHLENVFHTPGQAAAIRFFDDQSMDDYLAMREILNNKQVRKWMDDAVALTKSDFKDWAGDYSQDQFLFAVLDARLEDPEEMKKIRGFIYLYSEREEKARAKRMEKQGFLPPTSGVRHALEVSFALRPLKPNEHAGSGLISSALRQSCQQVRLLLDSPDNPDVRLFAFIDPENISAQRTVEAAGFVFQGSMKYDWDSEEKTYLYILDWDLLDQKIQQKLISIQQ